MTAVVARHEQYLGLVADVDRERDGHVREDDDVLQRNEQQLSHWQFLIGSRYKNDSAGWRLPPVGFPAVEPGEEVVLTVVADEPEAEILCGLLQANGIDCAYRDTEAIDSPLEDFTAAGAREILVRPADLEAARSLLPDGG
jgi:hypothetical protein